MAGGRTPALVLGVAALASAYGGDDPLRVLSLVPNAMQPGPQQLSGRDALTITFTHSVIALGADFGSGPVAPEFSPIILDPPVAGALRWVTTSVARFDADDDWPLELYLTVKMNPALCSWEGRCLAERDQTLSWTFSTPRLAIHASRAFSPNASALTGGMWDGRLDDGAWELPPDGAIELRFNSPVDRQLVASVLQFRSAKGGGAGGLTGCRAGVKLAECARKADACVRATAEPALAPGAACAIVIPQGSFFHRGAGKTRAELSVAVGGLAPFRFRFIGEPHNTNAPPRKLRYRRMRLHLQHGLGVGVDLKALEAAMSVKPLSKAGSLPISITRPSDGVILLSAPLQPSRQYEVHQPALLTHAVPDRPLVAPPPPHHHPHHHQPHHHPITNANSPSNPPIPPNPPTPTLQITVSAADGVVDGFGQPLRSSHHAFGMYDVKPAFVTPGAQRGYDAASDVRFAIAPPALVAPDTWPALVGGGRVACVHRSSSEAGDSSLSGSVDGCGAAGAEWVEIRSTSADVIPALISALRVQRATPSWPIVARLSAAPPADSFTLREAGLEGSLQRGPGLLLATSPSATWRGVDYASSLVSAGRLAVVALGAPDGGVLLWATDSAANTPAAGAMATLYEYPEGCRPWGSKPGCDAAEVMQLHRARVGDDGLLSLPAIGSVGMQRAVAVEGAATTSGGAAEVMSAPRDIRMIHHIIGMTHARINHIRFSIYT